MTNGVFLLFIAIIDPKTAEKCAAGRVIRNCFVKNGEKVNHIHCTLNAIISMFFFLLILDQLLPKSISLVL